MFYCSFIECFFKIHDSTHTLMGYSIDIGGFTYLIEDGKLARLICKNGDQVRTAPSINGLRIWPFIMVSAIELIIQGKKACGFVNIDSFCRSRRE